MILGLTKKKGERKRDPSLVSRPSAWAASCWNRGRRKSRACISSKVLLRFKGRVKGLTLNGLKKHASLWFYYFAELTTAGLAAAAAYPQISTLHNYEKKIKLHVQRSLRMQFEIFRRLLCGKDVLWRLRNPYTYFRCILWSYMFKHFIV